MSEADRLAAVPAEFATPVGVRAAPMSARFVRLPECIGLAQRADGGSGPHSQNAFRGRGLDGWPSSVFEFDLDEGRVAAAAVDDVVCSACVP